MAKTWATKCCSGTYKNNYQLCCGIKVNYNYNLPAANKADIIALVDTSIQEIKVKQSAE